MKLGGRVPTLLTLLHVWRESACICNMIFIQNYDRQVWKIHHVVGGKKAMSRNEWKVGELQEEIAQYLVKQISNVELNDKIK